jgi:hypothetical protein
LANEELLGIEEGNADDWASGSNGRYRCCILTHILK